MECSPVRRAQAVSVRPIKPRNYRLMKSPASEPLILKPPYFVSKLKRGSSSGALMVGKRQSRRPVTLHKGPVSI
jgi:hypothetical protein